MDKEVFNIEFVFDKASRNSLWEYISTAAGLAEWFADAVDIDGKLFTFQWKNYSNEAEVTGMVPNNYIRFHWLDDDHPDTFFEFRLEKIELTGGVSLEITDFAEKNEKESAVALWETQIRTLKRVLGL
ncbi:MAG: SRPBCC domain-containing protein [Candidatus Azobacteroides sp.]|nr:SRPBCC domain-containing protein [Candidatus Azobacteroides sp.]